MSDQDDHDTHDNYGTDDPIGSALAAAGQRLRRRAPDEVSSRQALARVTQHPRAPMPARRSLWPALIGAGLTAAAVVGLIAIRADDTEPLTPTTSPDQADAEVEPQPTTPATAPATTVTAPTSTTTGPAPSGVTLVVEGACITVTTAAGNASGCPQDTDLDHLEQRTFVADLDGPVVITSDSADPLDGLTATVDAGSITSTCRWDDLAPRIAAGRIVEIVVCNDTGVLAATTARADQEDRSMSYFTLPAPYIPDGVDLGPGTPIEGLPGALAFAAAVPSSDSFTCSLLLLPDRSEWKEACGLAGGPGSTAALVQIDPTGPLVHEITVDANGLITSARELDLMAPSSGCSIESARDLLRAVPASSIVTTIGCLGDKAALTSAAVLTQQGPPDGLISLALRDSDVWTITDSGTGIETELLFPVVPLETWSAWPESTVPGFRSYLWEPIIAIDTQPTIEGFADAVLATLATSDTDPEFPLDERLVAVQPDGLPLVVAQIDLGGDDSVTGAVIFVWLLEEFDDSGPIGWRARAVLGGEVCGRGEAAGSELCV